MEFAVGGAEMAEYLPLLEEELAYRGEDRRAPDWRKDELAPDVDFDVLIIGAGMSGSAGRAPAAASRCAVHDRREGRRRRRHVAREHVSRLSASTTRTTTTATRSRSATTGRSTSRPNPCCSSTSSVAPTTFGLREHDPVRHRGHRTRRGRTTSGSGRSPSGRPTGDEDIVDVHAVISAVGQLNRPCSPTSTGPRLLRGPVVPLGPVEPRRRPGRQAGGGHRHRRERGAVHPRDRAGGRRAGRVPAHPAVDGPDAGLPRRGAAGLRWLYTSGAVVQRVEPLLDLLEDGRRRPIAGVGSTRSGTATAQSVSAMNDIMRMVLTAYLEGEFADRPDLASR